MSLDSKTGMVLTQDPAERSLIEAILRGMGVELVGGAEAGRSLRMILRFLPDLIILCTDAKSATRGAVLGHVVDSRLPCKVVALAPSWTNAERDAALRLGYVATATTPIEIEPFTTLAREALALPLTILPWLRAEETPAPACVDCAQPTGVGAL
ncbi:MAG: hypothetical protein HYZ53_26075 [Planctomycetes bacterium]|nr:hypothetical protein [Planctomycetota bacterium]